MQKLATIHESDIAVEAPVEKPARYRRRTAVRAVMLRGNGQVALLNVEKYNYHKLPGGGVEAGAAVRFHYGFERDAPATGRLSLQLRPVVVHQSRGEEDLQRRRCRGPLRGLVARKDARTK